MKRNSKTLIWLSLLVIGMFIFSFALVPLYDVMCNVLGINGKTSNQTTQASQQINKARSINLQFLASVHSNLPWDFYPINKSITVHPGENKTIYFAAKNNSNKTMTVQAIPSTTPGEAAKYFHKIVCFCFNQQTLDAHQSVRMPIVFQISNKLPKHISDITLSYVLYKK